MQLMKPRDTEGPFVRTARICGLAAVGAGLLGSAALLHVTPVFAQTPPPAAAAAPAEPEEVTEVDRQVEKDAGASPSPHHRTGVVVSRRGVIIRDGETGHSHTWTSADGRQMTVIDDNAGELSPEQQRKLEEDVRRAEAKAAEAEARVNSPEFKAKIAAAVAKGAEAERMVNSPEFKAKIARAQARAAEAEARVNSPEFKAKIAAAQAKAAEAERMVNSPEFKAKIADAQARAEAAAQEGVRAAEEGARAAEAGARAQARAQAIMARTQARMAALSARVASRWDDDADHLPTP